MFTTLLLTLALAQPATPPPLYWRQAPLPENQTIHLVRPPWCHGNYCDPEKIIGGYNYGSDVYRPYDSVTRKWLEPTKVLPDAPAIPQRKVRNKLPTGVRNDQIHVAPILFGGVPMTEEEGSGVLNDDTSMPFLTVIAPKAEWRNTLDKLPAELKAGSRLKCLEPSNFHAKKFKVTGPVSVIYQKPDGAKIALSDPFDPAKFLAQVAQPNPSPIPLPIPADDTPSSFLWIAGAVIVFLVLRNR